MDFGSSLVLGLGLGGVISYLYLKSKTVKSQIKTTVSGNTEQSADREGKYCQIQVKLDVLEKQQQAQYLELQNMLKQIAASIKEQHTVAVPSKVVLPKSTIGRGLASLIASPNASSKAQTNIEGTTL